MPFHNTKIIKQMEKIFRQVSVMERLPKIDQIVVGFWDEFPDQCSKVVYGESGYWTEMNDYSECDQPNYWLEEVELPNYEDTRKARDAYSYSYLDPFRWGWKYGVKHILSKLKGEKNE